MKKMSTLTIFSTLYLTIKKKIMAYSRAVPLPKQFEQGGTEQKATDLHLNFTSKKVFVRDGTKLWPFFCLNLRLKLINVYFEGRTNTYAKGLIEKGTKVGLFF